MPAVQVPGSAGPIRAWLLVGVARVAMSTVKTTDKPRPLKRMRLPYIVAITGGGRAAQERWHQRGGDRRGRQRTARA